MLPDSFAQTGFFATPANPRNIARFQVMGERSSGTNFIKRLIGRNSDLKHSDELGWKHGFCQMLAIPSDLAVICVVRHPERWSLSMQAKPWHTVPDMQRLDFSGFIRAPWQTIYDKPRYLGRHSRAHVGQPLQQDRHPLTGAAFANLYALRQAKLAHLASFANRGCACVFLRLEDAQGDPKATFERIQSALNLAPRDQGFRPVAKPQGWRFRSAVGERPAPPDEMTSQDRAFMWSQLDLDQEARLGYRP